MSDKITVTGNITQPELRHTTAGVPVVHFRIGSTHRVPARDGRGWTDGETNWFSVSAFRGLAEHSFQSLHHGDRVVVSGKLHLREWDGPNGRSFSAEIEADAVGHDLRWGTSTFQKAPGGATPVDSGGAWSTDAPGTGTESGGEIHDGDAWSAPMSQSQPPAESDRELVPAGATDTPF